MAYNQQLLSLGWHHILWLDFIWSLF